MAAGVSDRLWSGKDRVTLWDASEQLKGGNSCMTIAEITPPYLDKTVILRLPDGEITTAKIAFVDNGYEDIIVPAASYPGMLEGRNLLEYKRKLHSSRPWRGSATESI
jgi:hypothetical protein